VLQNDAVGSQGTPDGRSPQGDASRLQKKHTSCQKPTAAAADITESAQLPMAQHSIH
jgi:hypothetical protein